MEDEVIDDQLEEQLEEDQLAEQEPAAAPEYLTKADFESFASALIERMGNNGGASATVAQPAADDDEESWDADIVKKASEIATRQAKEMFDSWQQEQLQREYPDIQSRAIHVLAGDLDPSVQKTARELLADSAPEYLREIPREGNQTSKILRGYLENEHNKALAAQRGQRPSAMGGGDFSPSRANSPVETMIRQLGFTGKDAEDLRKRNAK